MEIKLQCQEHIIWQEKKNYYLHMIEMAQVNFWVYSKCVYYENSLHLVIETVYLVDLIFCG